MNIGVALIVEKMREKLKAVRMVMAMNNDEKNGKTEKGVIGYNWMIWRLLMRVDYVEDQVKRRFSIWVADPK